MKKLLFAFALLMGTMFVSCNNTTKCADTAADTVVNTVDTAVADTVVVDSVM